MRRVVLAVDSGTQSTKVLVLDVEDGSFCGLGRARTAATTPSTQMSGGLRYALL